MARAYTNHDDGESLFLNEAMEHVIENCGAQLRAANTELLEAKLRLQQVSARLESAQEEERRRISRELDGETGLLLAAIRERLQDALCSESGRIARIEECLLMVGQAVIQIRALTAVGSAPGTTRARYPLS